MKILKKSYHVFLSLFICLTVFILPTNDLLHLHAEDTTAIYLSDLEPESVKVGYGSLQKDQGLEGLALRLRLTKNGAPTAYAKGLCAHAESTIVYNIADKGYERFQSYIGVNYSKTGGSTGFKVMVDGQTLYEIPVLYESDAQQFVDVAIPEDAQTLTLITTDGGDGITADHSVWADAKFLLNKTALERFGSFETTVPATLLAANTTSKITARAFKVNGEAIAIDENNIKFTSSNPTVLKVTKDGTIQTLQDGIAKVTITYTYQDITKTNEINFVIGKGDAATSWDVLSDDGSIHGVFSLINGTIHYAFTKEDESIVEDSTLQLKTNLGDFSNGLVFVNRSDERVIDNYTLYGAKVSEVQAEANQTTLNFEKNGVTFSIVVRVYNDGFAFQYKINTPTPSTLSISEEISQFQLPYNAVAQAMDYIEHHEAVAYEKQVSQLIDNYCMPLLYQTSKGTYALISEAGLNPEYSGAILKGNGKGVNAILSPEQTKNISTTSPFASPWRFVVIGDAATINENTMAETLNPELAYDASWIEPGVTAWTWLNRESTSDFETYKRYVDFAAEMGWAYVLLDEGWQPKGATGSGMNYQGYYEWTTELITYANQKGVGLLVWANNGDLNTAKKREIIKEWSEMGFKGIKPDFFNSQSQDTMKFYDALAKETAKYHMLLNIHGSNKATGERRTNPHLITKEGIFGAEQDLFKPSEVSAQHNCMLPFTRNAIGPADYTPMLSYRNAGERRSFTVTHQAALATVFESGIQCFADRPEVYRASPSYLYFKDYKTNFDESHLLGGIPGDYVNIARRSGNDWYVGVIVNNAREIEFSFDFLGEGEYYAMIYTDGATPEDMNAEYRVVTKADKMAFSIPATGGISMRIVKEKLSEPTELTLSASEIVLEQYESQDLEVTLTPSNVDFNKITWMSENPEIATVKDGKIIAKKPGITKVSATTGFENNVIASCDVIVKTPSYSLYKDWEILKNDFEKWSIQSETEMTIITQPGEYYSGSATAKNVVLHPLENGDFEAMVKLDFSPVGDYQSAGLLVYANDTCLFGVVRRSHSSLGGQILATIGLNGNTFFERSIKETNPNQPVYLKIKKVGANFSASYSYDNLTFTTFKDVYTNPNLSSASQIKAGLYAVNGNNRSGNIPATFENFRVTYGNTSTLLPFAQKNANKDNLLTVIKATSNLASEMFTEASYQVYAEAYQEALTTFGDVSVSQEQVDNVAANLQAAYDNLQERQVVNKDALRTSLEAYQIIDQGDYTSSSWHAYQEAYQQAQTVYDDADVTQEQVDTANSNLLSAYANLERTINYDKTSLLALYTSAQSKNKDRYSNSSWSLFITARLYAKEILQKPDATQEEIDQAYSELQHKMKNLVSVLRSEDGQVRIEGHFPESVTLAANVLKPEQFNLSSYTFEKGYDLTLEKDGAPYELETPVKVYMNVAEIRNKELHGVYIKENSCVEFLALSVDKNELYFTTDHFSKYAIISKTKTDAAASDSNVLLLQQPKTEDQTNRPLLMLLSILSGSITIYCLKKLKND